MSSHAIWTTRGQFAKSVHGASQSSGRPAVSVSKTRYIYRNHVWTYDIVYDATSSGRVFKVLTVVDEFARLALAVHGARSITAGVVKRVLEGLFEEHGAPAVIRSPSTRHS